MESYQMSGKENADSLSLSVTQVPAFSVCVSLDV